MSQHKPIRVGVIGLGFMGRMHINAYRKAAQEDRACELTAVCDRTERRRPPSDETSPAKQPFVVSGPDDDRICDLDGVRRYTDAAALLHDPHLDAVSICTYTPTHVELALAALNAGKHVLVEKPVALGHEAVQRLADAARAARRVCMPAMCMRFWPGWTWLKHTVERGELGRVRSAVFRRLGSVPGWSRDFYENIDQSGGALWDLHIHDVDVVRWLFGNPATVVATGSFLHVTTLYRFTDGPEHVVAEGGWGHEEAFGFRMSYVIRFDDATAEFDLGREPSLRLFRRGRTEFPTLPQATGYEAEVRHFLDCIAGRTNLTCPLADSVEVSRILEAEVLSLRSGEVVSLTER